MVKYKFQTFNYYLLLLFIIIVHHHCSSSLNLSVFIGIWQVNNNSESASTFSEKLKIKNLTCKSVFIRRNIDFEHSITAHHHQTCQFPLGPGRSTIILKVFPLFLKNWKPKIWSENPFSLSEIQISNIQSLFIIIKSVSFHWNLTGQQQF